MLICLLQEMDCLENNMDSLSEDCRNVVKDYTERIDEMPELNTIFAEACQRFWKEHCKVSLSHLHAYLKCLT